MSTQPHSEEEQGRRNSSPANQATSLLVADCGAVFTKVSLFGLVEGQYRLMARGEAPTTTTPPHEDITVGIIQAINVIEFITGRHFVEDKRIISPEQSTGDGVDVFIATISAGGPLQLAVMGSVSPALENLASQSISGLYAQAQTVPSPTFVAAITPAAVPVGAGPTGAGVAWTPERIALEWERQSGRIRELHPHAALIVGMADAPAGPTPLQEACQLLINAARERNEQRNGSSQDSAAQCSVIYAGAPQYVEAVRRMLNGVADVTRVDPLISQAQLGPISMAVGALYERNVIQHIPGYERLHSWSGSAPVATATSLSSLVRFLAQHYAMNVTAVDIGGATTTVMLAGEQGEFIPMVNTEVGVASNVGPVLQKVGWRRIARWLPFDTSEEEIRQFVLNRIRHPHALPTSPRELQISHAFAREAIALTLEEAKKNSMDWPDSDLILATGGILAHAPKYGQVAMTLLDALQPRGVTSMVLDKTMLVSQLGAVATVAPITAVQVNENDAVTHRLGTCVVPFGNVEPGQLAVRVGVEYSNGRQLTVDVMGGTIEVIPLRLNEQALLTLFPAPTVDVGLGPGERARAAEEIDGGLVGLIIDARGRPLVLPSDETERQARLLQWSQALGI
ncbi:MAG TPA: glutamate mutase L [Ktedonobacteraceae bacterium]|nr:glutamate mutase L [Ktedonobacteraceae bacterium]